MTMRNFSTEHGESLDMGTFTLVSTALVGSRAILRIGESDESALIEMDSDDPPASPVRFEWSATSSGATLRIDLSVAQIETLPNDTLRWKVRVITSAGQTVPVDGALGLITVKSGILAAAS
jgi:hypothetical protein